MGNNDADKQVAIFSDILTSCVLNQFKILLGELGFLTEKLKKKTIIQSYLRSCLIKPIPLKLPGQYWKHF